MILVAGHLVSSQNQIPAWELPALRIGDQGLVVGPPSGVYDALEAGMESAPSSSKAHWHWHDLQLQMRGHLVRQRLDEWVTVSLIACVGQGCSLPGGTTAHDGPEDLWGVVSMRYDRFGDILEIY